ncbi:hypothetical protein COP2_009307 [Malus domestica]
MEGIQYEAEDKIDYSPKNLLPNRRKVPNKSDVLYIEVRSISDAGITSRSYMVVDVMPFGICSLCSDCLVEGRHLLENQGQVYFQHA